MNSVFTNVGDPLSIHTLKYTGYPYVYSFPKMLPFLAKMLSFNIHVSLKFAFFETKVYTYGLPTEFNFGQAFRGIILKKSNLRH